MGRYHWAGINSVLRGWIQILFLLGSVLGVEGMYGGTALHVTLLILILHDDQYIFQLASIAPRHGGLLLLLLISKPNSSPSSEFFSSAADYLPSCGNQVTHSSPLFPLFSTDNNLQTQYLLTSQLPLPGPHPTRTVLPPLLRTHQTSFLPHIQNHYLHISQPDSNIQYYTVEVVTRVFNPTPREISAILSVNAVT